MCGDTRLTYAKAMDASVFPAVQNLLLAAHAVGLGSTLTTLPVLGGDELGTLLGLPTEVVPVAVVPLGHLPAPLGPPRRHRCGEGPPQPLRDAVPPDLSPACTGIGPHRRTARGRAVAVQDHRPGVIGFHVAPAVRRMVSRRTPSVVSKSSMASKSA